MIKDKNEYLVQTYEDAIFKYRRCLGAMFKFWTLEINEI